MEKTTLTISLPRTMKEFIGTKLREGRFSTPSEYIRSLIRDDQDLNGNGEVAALVRRLALPLAALNRSKLSSGKCRPSPASPLSLSSTLPPIMKPPCRSCSADTPICPWSRSEERRVGKECR